MSALLRPVLVVEDDPLIRDLIAAMLEDDRLEITFATGGEEAVSALSDAGFGPCAILTDIDLGPGPSGWEVAHHARRTNPDLPVIYMSGASAADWPARGVPGSRMLPKPFSAKALSDALSTHIQSPAPVR
jgi:CheY-like chemotaxis protein